MRSSLVLPVVFALVVLLGGCTVVDVRWAPHGGAHNHALISGYADAGWPASDSILQLGILDGPSRGALLYFQAWKLLRVEVGFVGLALGVGPLDGGVGVLVYDPRPPTYERYEHGEHAEDCEEECCEDDPGPADSAP